MVPELGREVSITSGCKEPQIQSFLTQKHLTFTKKYSRKKKGVEQYKTKPNVNWFHFLTHQFYHFSYAWVQSKMPPPCSSYPFPEIVLGSTGNGNACIHKHIYKTLKNNSSINFENKGSQINRMSIHLEKDSGDYLKGICNTINRKNKFIKKKENYSAHSEEQRD